MWREQWLIAGAPSTLPRNGARSLKEGMRLAARRALSHCLDVTVAQV